MTASAGTATAADEGLAAAAIGWDDWQSVRSVFDAVTLGTVDRWVHRPVSRQC